MAGWLHPGDIRLRDLKRPWHIREGVEVGVSSTCDVVLLCMLGMATAAARIMLQREEERCES
jgi:hypothetical protein